ncbi:MAG: AbrB/MazE/SpoVT family DNA-binding domain-containing protein [Candidatus Thioglobus sp.]|nr:AbrB/MazE/SpoVT family DNA-binding domain-containing protein [Candidatus Thioglobus sp.]
MQTQIRKIGNSKGVIIPAAFLSEAGFKDTANISIKNQQVIISPAPPSKKPRAGWLEAMKYYEPEKDIDVWEGFVELPSEQEGWEW